LNETPISSAGRLCNSFCKGTKIEVDNPFQLLKGIAVNGIWPRKKFKTKSAFIMLVGILFYYC
jgi:hypothetical protein